MLSRSPSGILPLLPMLFRLSWSQKLLAAVTLSSDPLMVNTLSLSSFTLLVLAAGLGKGLP
jgi:hypothetical protein